MHMVGACDAGRATITSFSPAAGLHKVLHYYPRAPAHKYQELSLVVIVRH